MNGGVQAAAIIDTMLCMASACSCCNHRGVALAAMSTLDDVVSAPSLLLGDRSEGREAWSCEATAKGRVRELQSHIFSRGSMICSGVLGEQKSKIYNWKAILHHHELSICLPVLGSFASLLVTGHCRYAWPQASPSCIAHQANMLDSSWMDSVVTASKKLDCSVFSQL
jgi:hypothetical protein